MKVLIIASFLLCFLNASLAQKADGSKKDTIPITHNALTPVYIGLIENGGFKQVNAAQNKKHNTYKSIPALIILNEKIITNDSHANKILDSIRANTIEFDAFTDSARTAIYGERAKGGVIKITTKAFAIQQYQKKLSAFSKEYKAYLEANKNRDEDFTYIFITTSTDAPNIMSGKSDEIIRKLYQLPKESIISVDFGEKFSVDSHIKDVIITTKK